jgi:transcriptional regulator with XRE-family HTH domain
LPRLKFGSFIYLPNGIIYRDISVNHTQLYYLKLTEYNSIKAVDDLADRITLIITQKGLRPSKVADATGITRSIMSRYLSNKSEISAKNLINLSQYLDVSPNWLLNGSDTPASIKISKSASVVDKNTTIEVQRELIERLKKDVDILEAKVKEWEEWKASSKERHAKGKTNTDQSISKNKQKVGFLKKHKPKK